MTDNLSRTLQGKAKALNVLKTLQGMKNKVTFSHLWETITKLARGIPDLDEPVLPKAQAQEPAYYCRGGGGGGW